MANKIYRLHNQIKHYEWGSPKIIPEFLGVENRGNVPYAEMWMGTHKSAPSLAENVSDSGAKIPLEEIAGEFPLLFKLLAVEKPLSIQAHPDKEKAREGFRLEEQAGVDIKSPARNYKDANHKPELLYAISRFTFMAGFRSIDYINKLMDELLITLPQLKEIIMPLKRSLKTNTLAVFFRILFDLTVLEREYISDLIINADVSKKDSVILPEQWALMKNFASQYPQDPAIISPLYLNYIVLEPGQAAFLPPGLLHSYISGFGVELMTSSDNVLRGGLTPKYIDIPELMNILDFTPHMPEIINPAPSSWFCYDSGVFSLAVMKGSGEEIAFPGKVPSICLVTEGELSVEGALFKKGESFFITKDALGLKLKGVFSAFFASI